MKAHDERADDARNDDGAGRAQRVMAQHHFQGEQGPGDGGVEGSGHSRCCARRQQGAHMGGGEAEALGEEGTKRCAQMHGRAFAAGAGAAAQGDGRDNRGAEATPDRQPPGTDGAGLDHIGNRLRPLGGVDVGEPQADHEAGERRPGDDDPGRRFLQQAEQVLLRVADPQELHTADGEAKAQCRIARGDAHQHRHQPYPGHGRRGGAPQS